MELPISTVIMLTVALVVLTGLSIFAIGSIGEGGEELWFWADWAEKESAEYTEQNIIYLGNLDTSGKEAVVETDKLAVTSIYNKDSNIRVLETDPSAGTARIVIGDPVYLTLNEGKEVSVDLDDDGTYDMTVKAEDIREESIKLMVKTLYPTEPCKSDAYHCVEKTNDAGSVCYGHCWNYDSPMVDSYVADCDSSEGLEVCCSCEGFPLEVCGDDHCGGEEDPSSCCLDCGCPSGQECVSNTCQDIPKTPPEGPTTREYEPGYWEININIPKSPSDSWPDTGMSYASSDPNSWWMVKPLYDYQVAYPDLSRTWGDYEHKYLTFQLNTKYKSGKWLIDMNLNGLSLGTDNEFLKPNDVWYQQVLDICPHPFYMTSTEWKWKVYDGETYSTPPHIWHDDLLCSEDQPSCTWNTYWPTGFVDTKHSPPNDLPDVHDIESVELSVEGEDWTIRVYPSDNAFDSRGLIRENWVKT